MTTRPDGPVAFLRARLDEDEAAIRESLSLAEMVGPIRGWCVSTHRPDGSLLGVGSYDPERALAEVAAKRSILKELAADASLLDDLEVNPSDYDVDDQVALKRVRRLLLALAQPYADYPDFDEAWRA